MTHPLHSSPITGPSSLLRGSPSLFGASVLSALRLEPLVPFPLASPARFSRSVPEPDRTTRRHKTTDSPPCWGAGGDDRERRLDGVADTFGKVLDLSCRVRAADRILEQGGAKAHPRRKGHVRAAALLPAERNTGSSPFSSTDQRIATDSVGVESAPCLAALVPSSWMTMAKPCVASGSRSTRGPSIVAP